VKYTALVKKEYDIEKIRCKCGVRYWEDASVDGVKDTEGTMIPNRDGDYWNITINLETGKIDNWPEVTAKTYYKVCDDGTYYLLNTDGMIVAQKSGYVPRFLSPNADSYGDYVIMNINKDGFIEGWRAKQQNIEEYFSDAE
jgi:hypothetical protein